MNDNTLERDVHKRLILAGIRELDEHGESDFSLRRVASRSGVSCAAPYKHFKNRDEFLQSIMQYVNDKWDLLFSQICKAYEDDIPRTVTESAAAAVRFFTANESYRAVLFSGASEMSPERRAKRDHILYEIDTLARRHCEGKPLERTEQISFAVQAIISGTIHMACGGELSDPERSIELLQNRIAAILKE